MRAPVSLSHIVQQAFLMGRLQMLGRITTMAGDSMQVSSMIKLDMNEFRRPVSYDICFEAFAFWCPWRWTYGDAIKTAILDQADWGPNTTDMGNNAQDWLLAPSGILPSHLPYDMGRIWNRYYRAPHYDEKTHTSIITTGQDMRDRYGLTCFAIQDYVTALCREDIDTEIIETADDTDLLTIHDIAKGITDYRGEARRTFQAERYVELYQNLYNARLPRDVYEEPHYLGSQKQWISPQSTGLPEGDTGGKVQARLQFKIPRRLYTEHGTLYIFGLVRPRQMYQNAAQWWDTAGHMGDYEMFSGDPDLQGRLPVQVTLGQLFTDTSSNTTLGTAPWGHWREWHPDFISSAFYEEDTGWLGRPTPTSLDDAQFVADYGDVMYSHKLGHGILEAHNAVGCKRFTQSSQTSLYYREIV